MILVHRARAFGFTRWIHIAGSLNRGESTPPGGLRCLEGGESIFRSPPRLVSRQAAELDPTTLGQKPVVRKEQAMVQ